MVATADLPGETLDPLRCKATNRNGRQCGQRAGWGTSHPGYGFCKRHGGASPNGRAHAAKLAALAAMPASGGEVDVNPLDALLYTVRRAAGLSLYYRTRHELALLEGTDVQMWAGLERNALADLNRWGKAAVDAGVAERLVRAAEHSAERLGAAVEAMLAAIVASGVELPPEARSRAVQAFTGQIAQLESGGDIEGSAV